MTKPERVDPDDPQRCQGIYASGSQCPNGAVDGAEYCTNCAPLLAETPEDKQRTWLRERFEMRVRLDIDPGEEIKLLRENLASINALIAARQEMIKDESSFLAHSSSLSSLLVAAEKITHSLVKLEREADLLLSKAALIRWGQKIVQAVSSKIEGKFDGWEDILLKLSEEVGDIIVEASNKEKENV